MMVFPSSFPQDVRVPEPVQLIDIMPTFLSVAHVNSKNLLIQGDSLMPLIWREDRGEWDGRIRFSFQPNAQIRWSPLPAPSDPPD